jgi:hypothetical protein
VHRNVESAYFEGVADRLELSGDPRILRAVEAEHGTRWIVTADPEGNKFCVCYTGRSRG